MICQTEKRVFLSVLRGMGTRGVGVVECMEYPVDGFDSQLLMNQTSQQALEADLFEMLVRGEGVLEFQLLHDDEAGAIGE